MPLRRPNLPGKCFRKRELRRHDVGFVRVFCHDKAGGQGKVLVPRYVVLSPTGARGLCPGHPAVRTAGAASRRVRLANGNVFGKS